MPSTCLLNAWYFFLEGRLEEILKQDLGERMNIQITPWDKSHVVKMDALYTPLTIENQTRGPLGFVAENTSGQNAVRDMDYKQIIENDSQGPKRILIKGNPGIGKTTWLRKIACDYSKGTFAYFKFVFMIILKAAIPGDTIQNIIVQQHPALEGNKISPEEIGDLLENHGDQCLLLLDGYDEVERKYNTERARCTPVRKLLEKRLFPNCNIIVTCRPEMSRDVPGTFTDFVCIMAWVYKRECKRVYWENSR